MVNNNKEKFTYILDLCVFLDKSYPHDLAWDEDLPRIGFTIGDKYQELQNVLLTLDINEAVVDEAISKGVNLIITHHPLIFNPIYKIEYDKTIGKIIYKLIQNNIAVYTMHTNFDVGIGGVADYLGKLLSLKNIVGDNMKNSYLRFGDVEEKTFGEYLEIVKDKLKQTGLKYAGDENKLIKSIGIIGGSGGEFDDVNVALKNNLDLYISSEFSLHVIQYAVANDLCIIEINHGVEKLALNHLKNKLFKLLPFEIHVSEIETDPFKYFK